MASKVKFTFRTYYSNSQTIYLGTNAGAFWSLRIDHNLHRLEIKRSNAGMCTVITVSVDFFTYIGEKRLSASGIMKKFDVNVNKQYLQFAESEIPLATDILEGTIEVEVLNDPNSSCTCQSRDVIVHDSSDNQLSGDFLHMLNAKDFTDAILKCGDAEFPVHRCMLSVRSPVFASMFKNQMKESQTGTVEISDVTPDVLQAALIYMYSSRTDHITLNLAEELLFAADKYLLDDLKLACVEELKKHTTVSNVSHFLALGDWIDDSLKEFAIDYVRKFNILPQVQCTDSWKSLRECRPDLVEEMFAAY